jgi:mono/diheme cytochrome c family protein
MVHDACRGAGRVRARGAGWALALWMGGVAALGAAPEAWSITTSPADLDAVERLHGGAIEHCDAAVAGQDFLEAFECGDELFETVFNAVDGVGANVGDGGRFTRGPRADLDGPAEWASHLPARATGPNAASCVACHQGAAIGGAGDGSGPTALNVMRDPFASADPGQFIQRNTPHLFGPGALQRLAEEMTAELRARFDAGVGEACASGARVDVALEAKGVSFGSIGVECGGAVDGAGVEGVNADLIVRPFQWKGIEPTLRSFSRGAEHNELGMQPVELSGDGVDGDGDGVADELSIPDLTAMAVYLAGQPRPVTELELNRLRLELAKLGEKDRIAELGLPTLSRDDVAQITHGEQLFAEIGCADCHRPALVIDDPVFSEPSRVTGYRDDPFPAGQPALAEEIRFDLTRDLPDNQFALGRRRLDLGNFERTRTGGAIVRLYGDLKRHDMGPGLAENVDETGHGASTWLTKELWGVGSSAEYLHDGRATTLAEAILEHGGEAEASRAAFAALPERDEASVVRFLANLVLFFPEEEAAAETQSADRRTRHGRRR